MIRIRQGEVCRIINNSSDITEVEVKIGEEVGKAINYDDLTGPIKIGDQVTLNTTAVFKNLGTGGTHFVMANWSNTEVDLDPKGHIMKLRYTPFQVKTLAVEEQENIYQQQLGEFKSLEGLPVIVGTLHSMLPLGAIGARKGTDKKLKIVYIMTDGAALPLKMSKMVQKLKNKGLIDETITIGHAFGGDYEAINIYSALIFAKEILKADIVIVSMGPGIVGTGTNFGFTGVEQGEIINAVNILGGQPVAIPRISFADKRDRHKGISHHTLTTLSKIALTQAIIALPIMEPEKKEYVHAQLLNSSLVQKHKIQYADSRFVLKALKEEYEMEVTTMGRKTNEDPEFFLAAASAGLVAASIAEKRY